MTDNTGIVISAIIGIVMIVMSILLLMGKGGSLIAGYNTMSEMEKAQYDEVALCKFMGKILLPIGILCPCVAIGAAYNINWLVTLFIIVTVGLVVYAVVYCNTGTRFRK